MADNSDLQKTLLAVQSLLSAITQNQNKESDDSESNAAPEFWVAKWVDYRGKYGLAYQLNDTSVGVLFNDDTHLLLFKDMEQMQYVENETETYFNMHQHPQELANKVELLKRFRDYMNNHLLPKAGERAPIQEGDALSRLPRMRIFFKTSVVIVMHLTNGTVQVNFLDNHHKYVL